MRYEMLWLPVLQWHCIVRHIECVLAVLMLLLQQ